MAERLDNDIDNDECRMNDDSLHVSSACLYSSKHVMMNGLYNVEKRILFGNSKQITCYF